MFSQKEIAWIIVAILIASFIGILPLTSDETPLSFLFSLAIFTIIILSNVIVKKLVAGYVSITIEYKIWEMHRFSWSERSKFKKPVPMGLISAILTNFLTAYLVG